MFYSHEVLTSRKHGVATVWLVATLGAKPSHRRIDRKQIFEVDVKKACQTIIDPGAPLALRLQGNLLYGVSSVYLRQTSYVLSDAQNVQTNMRMMLRTVENLALDPEASKARPEQLVLPDDPSFLPEFVVPPPDLLADLELVPDIEIVRSGDSQSLTPFASQQSRSSSHLGALGGLVLPSSSSPPVAASFKIPGVDEEDNSAEYGIIGHWSQLNDDPGFTFNEDGELLEITERKATPKTPTAVVIPGMMTDAAARQEVQEHQDGGLDDGVQIPDDIMDTDIPGPDEDAPAPDSATTIKQQNSDGSEEVVQSTSTVSAPMRQKQRKVVRTLPVDPRTELRNKDLADWNANYLSNMEAAVKEKNEKKMKQQAKKNAQQIIWGGGLGNIGHRFQGGPVPGAFDLFVGDNFFELVTGASSKRTAGKKHDRDSGIDEETQGESRNVRQRTQEPEEEVGRGVDEGFFMPDDEVELPREAPSPLDDHQLSSAMPWNITASVRGSSAVPRSALGRSENTRPGSRVVSASPLHGRSQPLPLESFGSVNLDSDLGNEGVELGHAGPSSPATEVAVGPQISPRMKEALSADSKNFLLFVADAVAEKRQRLRAALEDMAEPVQADATGDIEEISFDELLPPTENNKMVACQGLMMVLDLGCKGLLNVQQPEHFGDIDIKLAKEAKASEVVTISDDEESEFEDDETADAHYPPVQNIAVANVEQSANHEDDEQEENQGMGQFEEQFAVVQADLEDRESDDHDDLAG